MATKRKSTHVEVRTLDGAVSVAYKKRQVRNGKLSRSNSISSARGKPRARRSGNYRNSSSPICLRYCAYPGGYGSIIPVSKRTGRSRTSNIITLSNAE